MDNKKFNNLYVVTGKVILHYPHLFEKWSFNDDNTQKRFSTIIVIPKQEEETLSNIKAAEMSAYKNGVERYGEEFNENTVLFPLRDGDDWYVNELMYANSYYLSASSNFQPRVVNEKNMPLFQYNVPDGINARVGIMFRPYNVNGKKGISCILNNVKLFTKEVFSYKDLLSSPEDDFK